MRSTDLYRKSVLAMDGSEDGQSRERAASRRYSRPERKLNPTHKSPQLITLELISRLAGKTCESEGGNNHLRRIVDP